MGLPRLTEYWKGRSNPQARHTRGKFRPYITQTKDPHYYSKETSQGIKITKENVERGPIIKNWFTDTLASIVNRKWGPIIIINDGSKLHWVFGSISTFVISSLDPVDTFCPLSPSHSWTLILHGV